MAKPRQKISLDIATGILRPLGLTREQILRRIDRGEIEGEKNEWGRWFVYRDSCESYLADHTGSLA